MTTPYYSGIITNYVCTAECRHCMFGSSPSCPKEYITTEESENIASILEEAGTPSVHIGGGEPFMNFPALLSLIDALNRHGIGVDYIETNAFWAKDEDIVKNRLWELTKRGVTTVMVSSDPFHIEYVPLSRVLTLIKLLSEEGFDYFIWQERYLRKLIHLDHNRTYSKEELEKILGKNYITYTAREYGLGMNGRALAISYDIYPLKSVDELLKSPPCHNILSAQHCHFDLYGNAVPSGCPGLCANSRDYLCGDISTDKYPVMSRLVCGRIKSLFEYAHNLGFVPDPQGYPTKCSFCYAMRSFLSKNNPSDDLSPKCFYENIDKNLTERI
ncbi:MAG: radical SAM protein [Ruminococcaceae bacterium]|nr:radical SAM protein [Oscillospiraceae bacterium]